MKITPSVIILHVIALLYAYYNTYYIFDWTNVFLARIPEMLIKYLFIVVTFTILKNKLRQ